MRAAGEDFSAIGVEAVFADAVGAIVDDVDIVAATAAQDVLPLAAVEPVAAAIPGQGIVHAGADQVLDRGEAVARGFAAARLVEGEIDRNRRRRAAVIDGIVAGAA